MASKEEIISAIKRLAKELGRAPTLVEFEKRAKISDYQVTKYFESWTDAVKMAGLKPHRNNSKLDDNVLLEDWGSLVRKMRDIPTRDQYRRNGKFSANSFEKRFGPWSGIPNVFRETFAQNTEWADVLALLPPFEEIASHAPKRRSLKNLYDLSYVSTSSASGIVYTKLSDRTIYGEVLDFRGLRHAPLNELGVVFLFGMLSKELGYSVETIQHGFPDCEAKRLIGKGRWQRVRIEFEFESRSFRDHKHNPEGCDVIVCWKHNWPTCPDSLEVVELSSIIKTLAKKDL